MTGADAPAGIDMANCDKDQRLNFDIARREVPAQRLI
jgi:hypothetical protein